ncbi:MAG: hypothetical protein L3J71_09795 [Victivallaceae bacterium]|nr:hypothetical protein [Victivallaceae bacterium]
MSNQLATTKRRKSLAEHVAVIAALEEIAGKDGISVMTLMRQAIREVIRKHADSMSNKKRLRSIVMRYAPVPPLRIDTPRQIIRLKRQQREFDQVILDLNLDDSKAIEERNSVVSPRCNLRILELE